MSEREADAIIWKYDRRLAQDLRLFPIPFDELRVLQCREDLASLGRAMRRAFPTAEEALWNISANLGAPTRHQNEPEPKETP